MGWRVFTFQQGTSDKFWKIKVTGKEHTVHYGRTGTDGQTKTKAFPTAEKAKTAAEKLIAQKVKKGYSEGKTKKKATKKKATKKKATKKKATKKKATKKKATKKNASATKAGPEAMPSLLVKALNTKALHPAFAELGLVFDRPWKKLRGQPAFAFGTLDNNTVRSRLALWEPGAGPEAAAVVDVVPGSSPGQIARTFDEFVSLLLAFGTELRMSAMWSAMDRAPQPAPKLESAARSAAAKISKTLGVKKASPAGKTLLAAVLGLPTKTPKRPKKRPKPELLKKLHKSKKVVDDLFPLDFHVAWEPVGSTFGTQIDDVSVVALTGDGGLFGVWHRTERDQPVVYMSHGQEARVAKDLKEFLRLTLTLGAQSEELFDAAFQGNKRKLSKALKSSQELVDDTSRAASKRAAKALGLKLLKDPVGVLAKAMKAKPTPTFLQG